MTGFVLRRTRYLALAAACVLGPLVAVSESAGATRAQGHPASSGIMNSVSCAPGHCVAVGSSATSLSPEAWTLSHGTWRAAELPNATHPNHDLTGVSCPTADFCVGVGVAGNVDSFKGVGFAESQVNGAWHSMALPSGTVGLYAVSCVSATWCMAIGGRSGEPNTDGAIEWNGTTWSPVELAPVTPQTTGLSPWLDAVSCSSIDFCMAVGTSESTPLAEMWNGTSWTVTTAPPMNLIETYQPLFSVSCPSPSFCLAVGANLECCGVATGIAMAWNGSSWTTLTTAWAAQLTLSGVSCTSATSCLAVGTRSPNDSESFPLRGVAVPWTSTGWAAAIGDPLAAPSSLDAVSCSRASWCVGVGSLTPRTGGTHPLAERWNGRTLDRMWVPD